MKFAELKEAARKLGEPQLEVSLREMMRDPRFAAVLRLVDDSRENLTTAGAAPSVAYSFGAATLMAHYLGGVDALLSLESRLRAICEEAEEQRTG